MLNTYAVTYEIRSDWSQDVVCKAESANKAATVSREKLKKDHGKIAARWGVIESITPLQG